MNCDIFKRVACATVCLMSLALIAVVTGTAFAQSPDPGHQSHGPSTAPSEQSTAQQIAELRAQVARLEAVLQEKHQDRRASGSAASPMGRMGGMSGAGGGQGMGPMSGMSGGGSGMMNQRQMGGMSGGQGGGMGTMNMDGMGMMSGMGGAGSTAGGGGMSGGMTGMGGMEQGMMNMMGMMDMDMGMGAGGMKMTSASALPGFPGASHLYHVGATGFFLDHAPHIALSDQQRTSLAQIKEKALLDQSSVRRQIEEAEQQLWMLTAADQPDAAQIEAKISEIEKLRGQQRMVFIRAVGEAAKVLTDEQRQMLLGFKPSASQPPANMPGMGDM